MSTDYTYREQFHMAVAQSAAMMDKPEHGERLQKAVELVLAGGVIRHEDGSAAVKSGSHTYQIDPEEGCTCADSQHRTKYCKHALAVELMRRAEEWMGVHVNGTEPSQPALPSSTGWAVNQAPASCTLKFPLGGVECLYTMRDTDDDTLYARIRRILPKVLERMAPTQNETQRVGSEDYCSIHSVVMRQYTKGDQKWYSHKLADGSWCHGK